METWTWDLKGKWSLELGWDNANWLLQESWKLEARWLKRL